MVEAIGIAIALAAAYFAWRANQKSDDANTIARRALGLSEAEHEQRQLDREARARLVVSASIVGYEPGDDGVIRLGGSHGSLKVAITIQNQGGRDAGRGRVEVTLPLSMSDPAARWSDPSGRELPTYPQRAAQVGDVNIIDRKLDGVTRGVPESMWLTVPVAVPDRDGVNDYPIRVEVAAEGAEHETVHDRVLRIGRAPNV